MTFTANFSDTCKNCMQIQLVHKDIAEGQQGFPKSHPSWILVPGGC